jgi:hypothetical protein
MLAPLVVDLLISCTVIMLAGWTYDLIGNWTAASGQLACCPATSDVGRRERIDQGERFRLSDPQGAGYTQGVKTDPRHRQARHSAWILGTDGNHAQRPAPG